jgi:hypothetical protein
MSRKDIKKDGYGKIKYYDGRGKTKLAANAIALRGKRVPARASYLYMLILGYLTCQQENCL